MDLNEASLLVFESFTNLSPDCFLVDDMRALLHFHPGFYCKR